MGLFPRLTAVAGILLCPVIALGQTSSTSVRGTITDPSGAIPPGAKVELANIATQRANEQGEYRFPQLAPGTYLITVSSTGFGTESKRAELLAPESRSSLINVPVHNNRNSDALSYNQGNTNEYWLLNGGAIAGQSVAGSPQSLDPGGFGYPAVDGGFANSYNIAIGMITGLVPQITGNYNYQISKDGATGTLLPEGTFLDRHFKSNELEFYVQDAWHPLPKLTSQLVYDTRCYRPRMKQTGNSLHPRSMCTTGL